MRLKRNSIRNRVGKAYAQWNKKPLSFNPMSAIGGYKARIISPKNFDVVDEIAFYIACFFLFSAMSYVFFSISEGGFFGYFWAALAGLMMVGILVQCYIAIVNCYHKNNTDKPDS